MKELLFEILNKSEPYKLIKVVVGNNEFYVCREDSYLPMAVRFIEYEPEMERANYFYTYEPDDTVEYIKTHKITLDEREYIIETELTNIKFYDDYFQLTLDSVGGVSEYYVSYDSITYLSYCNSNSISASSKVVTNYNKIQYELNKGGF